MNPLKAFVSTLFSKNTMEKKLDTTSIYDIEINSLDGKPLDLKTFQGKFMLIVNVASKCGFTSQYKELQALSEKYSNDLVVIGVPCNQFGHQEPGTASDIQSFCDVNFGVTFPMTEKIEVKGKNQHALYTWLTQEINNGVKDSSVQWNFQKYLIDRKGNLVDYYSSATNPLSNKITNHIS
ncbi:glutathione peroxidase [Gaetbulibacter aestuarii]|uniref:Glutathione peroxidase n=1 Tax=Gaetbulibacter aestuarii TaxID=1502358 RepID=A0ABW7MZ27_9FLAO